MPAPPPASSAPGRRLLAFFAHPDDESWAAGGCLALCAQAGARVTLVCATRGEAGPDFQKGTGGSQETGPPLGARRFGELTEACHRLGAGPPICLELPDGRLAELDARPQVERLAALITALDPDVVVGLGPDGGYGHRDHLACTRWMDEAFRAAGAEHRCLLLQAAFPDGLLWPAHQALRRSPARWAIAHLDQAALGIHREQADLIVDTRPVRAIKRAALEAHRSQLPGGDPDRFLMPGLLDRLLDEEWFTLGAGPGLGPNAGDPFEGL